jgi:hypothetical protein
MCAAWLDGNAMIDTPMAPTTSTLQEQDANARSYIRALQGHSPREDVGDVGKWWQCCKTLESAYHNNPERIETVLHALQSAYPGLKALLRDDEPPLQGTRRHEQQGIPALPPEIEALMAQADTASPTLDRMIAFLSYWCTRSYDGYHEAVALWVLSAIAARRVWLDWRNGVWTPLYILLVSGSTTHAKTEAAKYGKKILEACGLGYLLAPDEITPQKLLYNMGGGSVPRNYATKDAQGKEYIRLNKAFSGQKGWLYDEFGNKLQEIMHAKGYAAMLYSLLKQLYDCKTSYEYDTLARENEIIDMPYLSVIGTATPKCLEPIASTKSAVWTDGMFARLSFVVPPKNELKLQSAPHEHCSVPGDICQALINWHWRLGFPDCQIVDAREKEELLAQAYGEDDKKNKKKEKKFEQPYEIEKGALPQIAIKMRPAVYHAQDAYYKALATIGLAAQLDERFTSTYGRLPEKALRIAMLLASVEGCEWIEMNHWARAMQITEHWRVDFHELIAQISTDAASTHNYGDMEDQILDVLTKLPEGRRVNARFVAQQTVALRKLGSPEIRKRLEEMVITYGIVQEGAGKGALFGLRAKEKEA